MPSKTEKSQITVTTTTPLAVPTREGGTGLLRDAEPGDYELPTLHLFQDVGKECEVYGEHPKGTWVNSQTQEEVDVADKLVVPVTGYKTVEAWWKRDAADGQGFVGRWNRPDEVPRDVQGNDDVSVYSIINYIVLVEGQDQPFLMRFTSTSYRVGKALATLELTRAATGRPLGAYGLSTRIASNDQGKWFAPVFRPTGDAPGDTADLAGMFAKAFSGRVVEAPEEPPI